MRILPAALAVSAALHTGAIAWVHTRPAPEPERERPVTSEPIQIVPVQVVEPPPTEVTLLDDHSVVAAAPVASSASHTRRRKGMPTISTGATTAVETGRPETTTAPPKRSTLMTMRHPKLEKGPSSDFWERFAANTKPLQPKEIAGEQLSAEIEQSEGRLKNPRWVANATPDQLAAERARLAHKRHEKSTAELQPDGAGTKAEHQTFKVKVNADGTIDRIDDKANLQRKGLGATFDVTDYMMRRQGIDPYSSYKLKVLDETRDERVAIGKRHRTQQLAMSKQHVQRNLERLWATTTDARERKQGLFELWDDCAERGSEELIAGGRAARDHVIGFVRSKLPAGSADAFTREELAHFNKRRKSRATFSPYQ